mmetsp:Transcript_129512/g.415175  ORF Transcript_129512/g.415175 Transcript_129512/m.415175 type:complete len:247 (-) Transcript_129512:797-1537(-)
MSRPMILRRFWISAFPVTCLKFASLTFKTLPFSGKTPYRSRPMTPKPATASDLAESPSVKISVHSLDCLPPARFASSSFGIPRTRVTLAFPALSCLLMSTFSLAFTQSRIISTTPLFRTCLIVFSDNSQVDPNLDCLVVSVSLVCESNAGFSIWQFTKTHKWFRTMAGLISIPPRFFDFTAFKITSINWSATCDTCVPPFTVLMEFTKLTCWKLPSVTLMATSHLAPHLSWTHGTGSSFFGRYNST